MATTKELEKMHEELIALLKDVQLELQKTNLRIDQLKERLDLKRKLIQELDDLIHDPDKGLFKRINDITNDLENIPDHEEIIQELEKDVNQNKFVIQSLTKIAGERLENLDSAVKTSQNSKKILWAIVVGAASLAAEQLIKFL
jgi:DNA repair exonuclease SbcCD ATPase subunit